MKKTRSFLLTAGIALVTAFTFSCSGDDGGSTPSSSSGGTQDGINLSDLPLSFDGELTGKIDVFLRIWRDDGEHEDEWGDKYDLLPAGKIENGKLSLSLQSSINSKYLDRSWDCYGEGTCQLSVVPQNLTFAYGSLVFSIRGKNDCSIRPSLTKPGDATYRGSALPVYNSESGTVTGTKSEENLNLNLSRGWQLIYFYRNGNRIGDDEIEYWVTDLPTGAKLEWELRCDD